MKQSPIILILLAVLMLQGCNKPSAESSEEKAAGSNEELNTVLAGYFKIKDALVKDDGAKAKEEAASLASSTGRYQSDLNEDLEAIAGTDDIDRQREAFEALSASMYDLSKKESKGQKIYKQFCPMAFDDKGAYWLSESKEIYNPYFGASMLKCGSVEEVID